MVHRGAAGPALIRRPCAPVRAGSTFRSTMRRILLKEGTEFTGRSGATLKIETLPTQGYGGRLNGRITVVRTFPPGEGRSLAHRHMDFDETYEVLEGIADA